MINKEMSIKIKKKLLDLNLTQFELAEEINISKEQLNNIINGREENLLLEAKILRKLELIKENIIIL